MWTPLLLLSRGSLRHQPHGRSPRKTMLCLCRYHHRGGDVLYKYYHYQPLFYHELLHLHCFRKHDLNNTPALYTYFTHTSMLSSERSYPPTRGRYILETEKRLLPSPVSNIVKKNSAVPCLTRLRNMPAWIFQIRPCPGRQLIFGGRTTLNALRHLWTERERERIAPATNLPFCLYRNRARRTQNNFDAVQNIFGRTP